MAQIEAAQARLPVIAGELVTIEPDSSRRAAGGEGADRSFRRWFAVGLLLSVAWIALCLAYAHFYAGWDSLAFLLPHEQASLLSAVVTPLIVLWLVVLYRRRGGELGAHARALEARLADQIGRAHV